MQDNNAVEVGETVTSGRPPPQCVISEAGSSNVVVQDSPLVPNQTNNAQVSASPGNLEFGNFLAWSLVFDIWIPYLDLFISFLCEMTDREPHNPIITKGPQILKLKLFYMAKVAPCAFQSY